MRTLREMEREAIDWQKDAAFAHVLATDPRYAHDAKYWQLKARKYATLAIHALDACNILKGMEHVD